MNDNNLNNGSDIITYSINAGSKNAMSSSAVLKYQSLTYDFISDLFKDNNNPEVAKFETLCNNATLRAETISAINGALPQ